MKSKLNPKETAFLVIDVQKKFCDPKGEQGTKRTEEIATRIQSIAPAFRHAGLPVFAIYFSNFDFDPKPSLEDAGFYKFKPAKKDKIVPKVMTDAFTSSDIIEQLEKAKIKNLIVSGFNTRACVYATVCSALAYAFNVIVLDDLTGSGKKTERYRDARVHKHLMKNKGAQIRRSASVLKQIG